MRQLYKNCLSRTVLGSKIEEADCRFDGVEGECEGELFGAFNLFQFEDCSILQRLKEEYSSLESSTDTLKELKGLRTMPTDLATKIVWREPFLRSIGETSAPRKVELTEPSVQQQQKSSKGLAGRTATPENSPKLRRDTKKIGTSRSKIVKLEAPNYLIDRKST